MRLADVDTIYDEVEKQYKGSTGIERNCNRNFLNLICDAPTISAVPVVRCLECVHSSMPSGFTQRYGKLGTLSCHFGPCNRRNVNENDFCSYGQRKEADHEVSEP